tara:strand:- start:4072 stop:4512 length:441 start_codon:yes stop_codon:yes gene_type:complete
VKKNIFSITFISLIFSSSVFAGTIKPGESTSCQDAKSITFEVAKMANKSNDKFGYTNNDRGTANLVVWKSSNYTTVPITLGPNDSNHSLMATDKGRTGLQVKGSMGRNKVTLNSMPNFSRGDSIGDIGGLVKITNTGVVAASVNCN